jgi:hypothetical protein
VAAAIRTLADIRAEWDAPFLAGPSDAAAMAARSQLTRDLAAAILAAGILDREHATRTQVGDLVITSAGWSRERGDLAAAKAEPGTPEWIAALGAHDHATLTSDGRGANREQWCCCSEPPFSEWVRYEHWTERGREAHGFVHSECRRLLQSG